VRILSSIRRSFNLSIEHAAGAAIGLCVVFFTLGSSSIPQLRTVGDDVRWLALAALWIAAAAFAFRDRHRLRVPGAAAPALLLGLMLVGLAVVSAAWSGDPRLTIMRAVSFAILLSAAGGLAIGAIGRPRVARFLAVGIVSLVLVASFVALVVRHDDAVQAAVADSAWRFRGIGENPNTLSLLAGIVAPLALWAAVAASGNLLARVAAWAPLALVVVTIALSGSRGALLAGFAGTIAFATQLRPFRLAAVTAVAAVAGFAGVVVVSQIPQPTAVVQAPPAPGNGAGGGAGSGLGLGAGSVSDPGSATPGGGAASPSPSLPALSDELGAYGASSRRTLLGTSGRAQAWDAAIRQANERPLLGYGFGTEEHVFFDRFQTFEGSRPENSYIGMYLTLGLVGLATFLLLLLALFVMGVRGARLLAMPERRLFAACLGAFVGGAAVMCVQSYAYAAGNLATAAFWTCAFMLPVAATWHARHTA
jgi:hypothetical protein